MISAISSTLEVSESYAADIRADRHRRPVSARTSDVHHSQHCAGH
jgi:hypothetical protein